MNENEKRILTILNHSGPLTRKEIGAACAISWAATVKLVSRLEEKGLIVCLGESETKTENGKTSLIYAVAENRPLAIGIDVEYTTTRVAVHNLRWQVFYSENLPTPQGMDQASCVSYLADIVTRCKERLGSRGLAIEGVGVGMPIWLFASKRPFFTQVARVLSEACGLPVVADNNTRAYTLYLQRKLGIGASFAAFVIRSGIGTGIAIGGELYRGEDGLAGELGHLTVEPNGLPCRCGKRGCAETKCNQRAIASRWAEVRDGTPLPESGSDHDAKTELSLVEDLFTEAVAGKEAAKKVIAEISGHLVFLISVLSLSMDIRRIVLTGHFGEDAAPLVKLVEDGLKKELHPRFRYGVSYERLDDEGFLVGASMLFLRAFCDFSVLDVKNAS